MLHGTKAVEEITHVLILRETSSLRSLTSGQNVQWLVDQSEPGLEVIGISRGGYRSTGADCIAAFRIDAMRSSI